jgi:hypothetical protein
MRELEPKQLTLVSHYGPKPAAFARLIGDLHARLSALSSFRPYAVEQVHATLVALEGQRAGDGVRNLNFRRSRGEDRVMDLAGLISYLRSEELPAIDVAIGGFAADRSYPFASQGVHPHVRSFSIQGQRVVAMGWPWGGASAPGALHALRRRFQRFGILHKWHARLDDVDDDFFFVLGRLTAPVSEERARAIEADCRAALAERPPCVLRIDASTLTFVRYDDPDLPPERCTTLALHDETVTASRLLAGYPKGAGGTPSVKPKP